MPDSDAAQTLEAIIDQDIDDIDAYLVHADRLRQQGDPHGEFILLPYDASRQPHRYAGFPMPNRLI